VSVPDLPCSICLDNFGCNADQVFVTDDCHHHFHKWCLGRYLEHVLTEQAIDNDEEKVGFLAAG